VYNHVGALDNLVGLVCEECESLDGVTSQPSPRPGEEDVIEYYCRDCKAEWVEYV
jgi:hypothetical protein